ncbi:hypothetical protein C5167_043805 [Papaver somniferum]|uniref:Uncharacterized protein n=1 Tax=Papaver somniferum TaxID=3469 RepID=A0A4Y7LAN1_PAPSO|nr:hypothetical protein C5167_043805 [Papaver somniferum]
MGKLGKLIMKIIQGLPLMLASLDGIHDSAKTIGVALDQLVVCIESWQKSIHGKLISFRLDEKPLFPLLPMKDSTYLPLQKTVISGNKRGFSDAMMSFQR